MGAFSKAARPLLAGTYFNIESEQPALPATAVGRTALIAGTHVWGPFKAATPTVSLADFLDKFGGNPNNPSPLYIAVRNAFLGEGRPDFGGAGEVIVYRFGGSAAAKAAHVFQNSTPAAALTLTAKYEGTRGNDLRVTTQDHAGDATMNELLIIDGAGGGSTVLETYVYLDTDIASLAAQINAGSDWVTATSTITGVALATVTATALTGGNDGSTLVSGDYTAALAQFDLQKFGVLAFENLTDTSIQASVKTWAQGQQIAGRRFFTVFGGALDEDVATANTRSLAMNDPDILNIGVGSVRDNNLLDANGNPIVLSTAQLASRIAGIAANRGERYSLTFSRLVGVDLLNGATAAQLKLAYQAGTMVLDRFSDLQATVRVNKGLTTYSTTTDATKPRKIFGTPRYMAVVHGLQDDLQSWGDENIVGVTTVDDETRSAAIAHVITLLEQYRQIGAIQRGYIVTIDPSPPPSDDDDFIAFVIGASFGRSTEQVYFTARLG